MTAKIQIFESNSQPIQNIGFLSNVVYDRKDTNFWKQFTTTKSYLHQQQGLFMTAKIQIFESNSQPVSLLLWLLLSCLWPQRYKFLKAIHNTHPTLAPLFGVVYDRKDTNFWKQFTTMCSWCCSVYRLFMTAKIQIFESNSQQIQMYEFGVDGCLWPQRYKFLKAIHNKVWVFPI